MAIGMLAPLVLAILGRNADAASRPAFSSPEIVNVSEPFTLRLISNGAAIKTWLVQWGDGSQSRQNQGDAADIALSHTYGAAGAYRISVSVLHPDGTQESAARDYPLAIMADKPVDYVRYWGKGPSAQAPALPWSGASAGPAPVVTKPADRFSAEFWLCPADFDGRQDILSSRTAQGVRIYLEGRSLCVQLPKGDIFTQPLPLGLSAGAWHHIAVCYDRAALFPYENTMRFYVDGILAGEQHLDVYDTGSVTLPDAILGTGSNGLPSLKGAISDLALYDVALPPDRILRHAAILTHPGVETVTAVPVAVKFFTVDAPRITRTVNVPLDPTPGVDNGPALRAAIGAATAGTRLQIIDKATGKPDAASYYFNSLDKGNDWSAIRIIGKDDLEVDGGGATLVFGVNCRQFLVKNCRRVAFRNFSFDLDQKKYRVAVYARILSLDPSTGDARFQFVNGRDLSPDRTVPKDISMWRWRGHDPRTLRIGHGPFFNTGAAFEKRPVRDAGDPSILTGTVRHSYIGMLEKYREGPNFFLINNSRFQNTPVGIWNCEQVTFDRVNFYASLGMVFLSSELDHLSVTNCKIGLPPGLTAADRPLAAGADGYHFHEMRGCLLFENNEIALTDDDPISIKAGVWRDIKPAGPASVVLHDAHPGDEFVFYRWDFSPLDFEATVLKMEGGIARLDRNLPANPPASFIAQDAKHPTANWIIKDSYLHDYYGRLLLCAPHGLITGNEIHDSYVHLGANDAPFDSAGIASQVCAVNNLFVNTDVDTGIWGASSTYPVFRDVAIVNNSFIGRGLSLGNAGAPLVCGNYFENHPENARKATTKWIAVSLAHCTNPLVMGNEELSSGAQKFDLKSTQTEGMTDENNSVLEPGAKPALLNASLP